VSCAEHPKNYFVGGCITCTHNELVRYQAMYRELRDVVRERRRLDVARIVNDEHTDRLVFGIELAEEEAS